MVIWRVVLLTLSISLGSSSAHGMFWQVISNESNNCASCRKGLNLLDPEDVQLMCGHRYDKECWKEIVSKGEFFCNKDVEKEGKKVSCNYFIYFEFLDYVVRDGLLGELHILNTDLSSAENKKELQEHFLMTDEEYNYLETAIFFLCKRTDFLNECLSGIYFFQQADVVGKDSSLDDDFSGKKDENVYLSKKVNTRLLFMRDEIKNFIDNILNRKHISCVIGLHNFFERIYKRANGKDCSVIFLDIVRASIRDIAQCLIAMYKKLAGDETREGLIEAYYKSISREIREREIPEQEKKDFFDKKQKFIAILEKYRKSLNSLHQNEQGETSGSIFSSTSISSLLSKLRIT